ncbi:MAG: 3-isopropylmalate dehydratase small subunit [Xanthomonadales bacterium]|nr:3-isopropylmalate dehydratase small subunit [Xanthomonadales bacterium]NIN60561.1 3-isopropylmalate dehydratase small subunit [Xanthomonadales bacterium]NIN75913.1 3-isopropylmalate dehydratase small subunit [Xanthomonadales bacterium]NIO15005.1 3-isopropylmalate dehydratase small subunit [Xanthomonadales bacterium]NIP12954.1 3-isopropylmalate dehydratase small subunit [Xanthomonadales bacterium]
MEPFTRHEGVTAALLRANIDTDTIIPSREMKRVSRHGLADGLFADWRYLDPANREPDPGFVLNTPAYRGASILLAGANFGCGSSREHAVWALREYGFRAVLAPSFGTIFARNCIANGVVPVVLEARVIEQLAGQVAPDPQHRRLAIDIETLCVTDPEGGRHPFALDAASRETLLSGLDPIDLTLRMGDEIERFEAQDRLTRPWAYLAD